MKLFGYELPLRSTCKIHLQSWAASVYRTTHGSGGARLRAFCVGLPRSGTHSVAYMLARSLRSAHEPRAHGTVAHILRHIQGCYSDRTIEGILLARDAWLGLNLESSFYLNHVVGYLADLFPDARFILTIRDPLSWMVSETKQNVRSREFPIWKALETARYGCYGSSYAQPEKCNQASGDAFPIRNYLMYWKDHIQRVLDAVPSNRLLVVRTHEISAASAPLAKLLNIRECDVDLSRSHADRGRPFGFDLLSHVSQEYIDDQISEVCGDMAAKWFPDVTQPMQYRQPQRQQAVAKLLRH